MSNVINPSQVSRVIHSTTLLRKTMKTVFKSFSLFAAAAALFATSMSYALDWPSDMANQLAVLKRAATPSGDRAASGAADAFQTFAIDEEFSDGVNFSTMPGATVLYVR